jgi:HEAT repeat protein
MARLVQQLSDTSVDTRARAIKALGDSGDPAAVLPLIACLKHRQNDVKKLAAAELGKIRDRRAIRPLVVAMIGLREPIDALEAIDAAWKTSEEAAAAVADLEEELKATDNMRRQSIFDVLATIGSPRAVDVLIAHLSEPDGRTAAAAAVGLTGLGDLRAVDPLIALLKHRGPEARAAAIDALMSLGDRTFVAELNTMVVADADAKVRMAAAEALGTLTDPSSYESLAAASLGDKNPGVLQAAKAAFAKIPKRTRAKT